MIKGVIDMENEINAVCTNCGGNLVPDQEGKIYRCLFCGVAFGSSILFNKDAEYKAYKAAMADEFNEADVWYRCVLMRDPGYAKALRGRILCAGKWKSLSEINTEVLMSGVRYESVLDRIDEAVEHTHDEETKEFFTDFRKLMDLLALIMKKNLEMKPLEGLIDKLKEKRNEVIEDTKEETHYAEKAVNSELYKADADRSRLMKSRNSLYDEFKTLRTKLISVENKLKLDVRPVPASD